jgi:hypothetical protein
MNTSQGSNFPAQLDASESEAHAARESFTWGPQTWWMLCALIWLFRYYVRDVPEVARSTMWIALVMTLLGVAGTVFAVRRARRRIVLYARGGQIGCYRGGVFQYSFAPDEMQRVRKDFFSRMMLVLKGLIPLLAIMAILVFVAFEAWKQSATPRAQDLALLLYAILCTIFGFAAMVRSNFILAFFWLPNGNGKTDQPAHFYQRELQKLLPEGTTPSQTVL